MREKASRMFLLFHMFSVRIMGKKWTQTSVWWHMPLPTNSRGKEGRVQGLSGLYRDPTPKAKVRRGAERGRARRRGVKGRRWRCGDRRREKIGEEGLFEEHYGIRALSEVWASGTQGAEHSSLRPWCSGRD